MQLAFCTPVTGMVPMIIAFLVIPVQTMVTQPMKPVVPVEEEPLDTVDMHQLELQPVTLFLLEEGFPQLVTCPSLQRRKVALTSWLGGMILLGASMIATIMASMTFAVALDTLIQTMATMPVRHAALVEVDQQVAPTMRLLLEAHLLRHL